MMPTPMTPYLTASPIHSLLGSVGFILSTRAGIALRASTHDWRWASVRAGSAAHFVSSSIIGSTASLTFSCAAMISAFVFSLAVTANNSRSGIVPINASLNVTNAFDLDAAQPQSTLLAELAYGGDSDANDPATWQTGLGALEITASTDAAGTFAIVPEPSSAAVLGIALVAIAGWRRSTKA